MSKPTPGPWHVGNGEKLDFFEGPRTVIAPTPNDSPTKFRPDDRRVICKVNDLSDHRGEADARLIASAPELCNVAEALLLFYTVDWTDERVDRWLELTGSAEATTKALCDFARRILAKAGAQ